MNDLQKITLDGVEYIRADSLPTPVGPPSPTQIVVIEGRWNIVGKVSISDNETIITDAKVIRYWGTTKGLGELAAGGPTSKTKLDPIGTVRVPANKVVMTVDTEGSLWT